MSFNESNFSATHVYQLTVARHQKQSQAWTTDDFGLTFTYKEFREAHMFSVYINAFFLAC